MFETVKIYWLFDTRPEAITAATPGGTPFYCGLARGRSLKRRLDAHIRETYSKKSCRAAGVRVAECDPHIRIQEMEDVSPYLSLPEVQERLWYWVENLRLLYPGCCVNKNRIGAPRKHLKPVKKKDCHAAVQARRLTTRAKKTRNHVKKARLLGRVEYWKGRAKRIPWQIS